MRRPRMLRAFGPSDRPPPTSNGNGHTPEERQRDDDRAAHQRAVAREHGWVYAERNQHAIQGWPRAALPPGPLGQVRNEITGLHHGHPFRAFDYVHRPTEDAEPTTLPIYAVGLPASVPYLYVWERETATHDFYAESPNASFATELLTDDVRRDIREYGFTDVVFDRDLLICTEEGGGPTDMEARLDALVAVVTDIPDEVWTHWGTPLTR